MNFFLLRMSFLKYDLRQICMAAVFIGAKLEDINRKVRDIITVFHHVFQV